MSANRHTFGPAPTSLRSNMSSFIRDTLYSGPPRSNGIVNAEPQTVSLTSPRQQTSAPAATAAASARGSHSSKFAVLNSLQQPSPPFAQDPTTSPRAQPSHAPNRALDLSSLLAGVGQHASSSSAPNVGGSSLSSGQKDDGATLGQNAPHQPSGPKPRVTGRVPRTLSGRPRPQVGVAPVQAPVPSTTATANMATSGISSGPTTPKRQQSAAPSRPGTSGQQVFVPEPSPDAPMRPNEDEATAPLSMNPMPAAGILGGIAPSAGNQTARGRPQSAAKAALTPIDPLGDGDVAQPAPGTLASLGGCAVGPEFRGMQPTRVLALYEAKLSKYERREVLDYDDVYFIGPDAAKADAPVPNEPNFGYDNDRGDYKVCKNDHIAYRYEILSELGHGSFGQVLRAKDYKRNCDCALKIIRNRRRFHQQAQVEIQILEHLRSRDPDDRSCTVRMLNYFQFRSHTCITFEIHAMNLYELTKLNRYQPFPPALIKRFTGQLLVAVSFMWREQIVHCDLKPENILLKQENKTGIKVIDFGSSCFEDRRVYSYIQSRFYRAPEIILGMPYGRPIDLWSIGCIICEMAIGYPIFPGENEHEQLLCIMEVLGVPPQRVVDKSPRKTKFFDTSNQPRLVPNSRNKLRRPSTKELAAVLRTEDQTFVDFVLKFLKWDPAERITPNEAMRHPYIAECFHQETIPTGPSTAGQAMVDTADQPSSSNKAAAAAAASRGPSTAARSSRPSSSMPASEAEPQPSLPVSSVAAHHARHAQPSARTARGPGLHQLGSLSGTGIGQPMVGNGSQSARGAAAALPSIGASASTTNSLLSNAVRRQPRAGRMQFSNSNENVL